MAVGTSPREEQRSPQSKARAFALPAIPAFLVVALGAVVLRLVYGPGAIGYDAAWSLWWGDQLAHGQVPEFRGPIAPTPHPLSNLVAAVLTPLGDLAPAGLDALHVVAWAVLGWAGFRLGRALFNPAAGAIFALILLTRPLLLNASGQNLVDLPFLTFVVWAAAVEAERPRTRPVPVLVLLTLAGLLRPEGWPLAVAYVVYLVVVGKPRPARIAPLVALALSAPAIWMLFDLVATGDPLWSLHGTQSLAAELERPRGLPRAVSTLPFLLQDNLLVTVMWVALAGVVLGLSLLPERSALPAVLIGLGMLGFLLLGVAGLPLLYRYLGLPAAMLMLFAAVAVTGWALLAPGAWRAAWIPIAAALALVLLSGVPRTVSHLGHVKEFLGVRADVQRDLDAIADAPAVRRALAACPRLYVPDHKPIPLLATWLDRKPATIATLPARRADAVFVLYASRRAANNYSIARPAPPPARLIGSGRLRVIHTNDSWIAYSGCR